MQNQVIRVTLAPRLLIRGDVIPRFAERPLNSKTFQVDTAPSQGICCDQVSLRSETVNKKGSSNAHQGKVAFATTHRCGVSNNPVGHRGRTRACRAW